MTPLLGDQQVVNTEVNIPQCTAHNMVPILTFEIKTLSNYSKYNVTRRHQAPKTLDNATKVRFTQAEGVFHPT